MAEQFTKDWIVPEGFLQKHTATPEGRKDDQGKLPYDLLPPELLEATATVLRFGARKYTVKAENEWQRLLLVASAEGIQLTTQDGCVVSVTRNTLGQPIQSLQSASVKIVETGKPKTLIECASWRSVDELIQRRVNATREHLGSLGCETTASLRNATTSYALKGVQSVEQQSTCILTIATPRGSLEVFFVPDAITDSDFWMTVWRGLNEHFDISKPQNKTGARNWEKGMHWSRPFAALMRHMWAWWRGNNLDDESGLPHLWHAACCIAFLIAYEWRATGVDDRPEHRQDIK